MLSFPLPLPLLLPLHLLLRAISSHQYVSLLPQRCHLFSLCFLYYCVPCVSQTLDSAPSYTCPQLSTSTPTSRKLSWADLTEHDYDVKWLYGEETAYLTLLAPPAPTPNETTSTLGPRPGLAAPCSLCDHPPNNALAQCACGHFYCGQHGGTCACNFTGCGLCLAHHPCPLDAAVSSPTLLEALDLARATVAEPPEQASSISEVATLTTSTAQVIRKRASQVSWRASCVSCP